MVGRKTPGKGQAKDRRGTVRNDDWHGWSGWWAPGRDQPEGNDWGDQTGWMEERETDEEESDSQDERDATEEEERAR